MAIRLRTVNGIRIALCAAETDKLPGDIYLDDNDHYALAAKFARDNNTGVIYDVEWKVMDIQVNIEKANERDLWLVKRGI